MIRDILKKDYEKVYLLGEAYHNNFRKMYDLDDYQDKNYFNISVCEEDGEIKGYLMYSDVEGIIDIYDIAVKKEHQHHKIGSRLLDNLITKSKKKDKIMLEVRIDNQIAIDMYEKFGFKKIHTREKYYGETDAYVMERDNENE